MRKLGPDSGVRTGILAELPRVSSLLYRPRVRPRPSDGFETQGAQKAQPVRPVAPAVKSMTFVYDAGAHQGLTNLRLVGTFDPRTGAFDPSWGNGQSVPMKPIGDGKWAATVQLLDDGPHSWQWGVLADGPTGKGQWAMMGEDGPHFTLDLPGQTVQYAPTTYHRMGARPGPNGDARFGFWAPDAKGVCLKVNSQDGSVARYPLTRGDDGVWSTDLPGAWTSLVGKSYAYEVTGSDGAVVDKPDPYAWAMQGEQRGVGKVYVDPNTAVEVNPLSPGAIPFMRFEIPGEADHLRAKLVLKDAGGRPLTKQELLDRLGAFDARMDPSLSNRLRGGEFDDLWSHHLNDDGSIDLTKEGTSWQTLVNDPEKLAGLRYELQLWDLGADGKPYLVPSKRAGENDPWSDLITPQSGTDFRSPLIVDSTFAWKNDQSPRERDFHKWVIEQIHVGSVFGADENSQRSTFEDVRERLSYFKSLGVNAIELLPTNEFAGTRDWGYTGVSSLATESSYGFTDRDGRWVTGMEALKRLIDEAHAQGINVINDVVYNHIGGDDNFLWNLDGPQNPYFNWSADPSSVQAKQTPWGPMPAYDQAMVKQFLVDHAVAQVEELHFDGLRFDFTQGIKESDLGGQAGWQMLREMNRQLHFFHPGFFTAAEQFDYDPSMTQPSGANGSGGAGFDAQWYTEYQHRLVHDNSLPSIIQQAVAGQRTDMDRFMNLLAAPRGLSSWGNAVTIISDHDEVGNGDRTVNVANGDQPGMPSQYARNVARLVAAVGMTSPGTPMFFQGDESMAQNGFRWGAPSTWDTGWSWETLGKSWNWNELTFNDDRKALYQRLLALPANARLGDPQYLALNAVDRQVVDDLSKLSPSDQAQAMLDITRRQTFRLYQDAIALRKSSPAFDAGAQVQPIYVHDDNSVAAFLRQSGGDEYLVAVSLNHQNQAAYPLPLPEGRWQEVLNTDAARYGGSGVDNTGTLGPGAGLNLPAGGCVVFKKVAEG